MKTFKEFLFEAVNEGDIMEGIFAIVCGLYLAQGRLDKSEVNAIRSKVDFEKATKEQVSILIADKQKQGLDTVSIQLRLRLKSVSSTLGAYGTDFDPVKDVGKIGTKIDLMIKNAESSTYLKVLKTKLDSHLKNSVKENILITIIADGVEGESSGGTVKGDVSILFDIHDEEGTILDQPVMIPFSLKSNSKTVSNRSPIDGMLEAADAFGVVYTDAEKTDFRMRGSKVTDTTDALFKYLNMMFADFGKRLEQKTSEDITRVAFDFLQKNVHGSDNAHLVDIASKIKEISPVSLHNLQSAGLVLKAQVQGAYIRFVDVSNPKKYLFQFRLKLRTKTSGGTERKFYVELGNLIK